jgi:uncharacterized membrane protein YqjE
VEAHGVGDGVSEPAANLPALVGRLGEDLVTLLDSKLRLLKIEVRDDLTSYLRGSIAVGAGGLVAAVGFALLNVALAFVVAGLLEESALGQPARYAIGFAITGAVYVVAGVVVVLMAKARLVRLDLTPERTVAELGKDREWVKGER